MTKIQTYLSLKKPYASGTISIKEFVERIKIHKPDANISHLKIFDKEIYNKKKTLLPCVSINFRFKHNKKVQNITRSTGLLYVDFDKKGFDIASIDPRFIHAYWKSVSGQGYGAIFKVKGLSSASHELFIAQYKELAKILNFSKWFDEKAARRTQGCIISNDPDAVYNENSLSIDLSKVKVNIDIKNSIKIKVKNKNKEYSHCALLESPELTIENFTRRPPTDGKRQLWLDNRHHPKLHDESARLIYPEELPYYQVSLFGFEEGNRNSMVSIALTNAAFLNMAVPMSEIGKAVYNMMDAEKAENLPDEEFYSILNKVAIRRSTKALVPIPDKRAYFVAAAEGVDKGKVKNLLRKEETINEVVSTIERHRKEDRKLTKTGVARDMNKHRNTVAEHWDEAIRRIEMKEALIEDIESEEASMDIVAYVTTVDDIVIVRKHQLEDTLTELRSGELKGLLEFNSRYAEKYLGALDLAGLDFVSEVPDKLDIEEILDID